MIQKDLMHELIKEYESVRKLNNKEKELLPYYQFSGLHMGRYIGIYATIYFMLKKIYS